jgi:hypothetical protein
MKKGVLVGIILAAGLFYGCEFFVKPDTPFGGGNLVVTAGAGNARAAYTDEEINAFRYVFTFTGPGGELIRELSPGESSLRLSVALGEWTIAAKASNDDNVLTGTGSVTVTVKAGSNSVKVPMKAVGEDPLSYTVSGTITTDNPGGPVSGASVQLKAGAALIGSTTTAGDGTYTISDVPDGVYTIEVSLSGYAPGTVSVEVIGRDISDMGLTLVSLPVPQDLKTRFGISTSGVPGVTDVFNALHDLISSPNAGDDFTTIIQLGDWIDLDSLTVARYHTGTEAPDDANDSDSDTDRENGAINTSNTDVTKGKLLRLIVVGINSFDGINGNNTPHVVFQFQNLPGTHRMNPTGTNVGGYAASEMRAYLTGNFYTGLTAAGVPDAVVWAPIRQVWNGFTQAEQNLTASTNTTVDTITDKFWLPTEWEMSGANTWSVYEDSGNQARLDYYTDNASHIKYNNSDAVWWYWKASPSSGFSTAFCMRYNGGGDSHVSANSVAGVAPAFCVK